MQSCEHLFTELSGAEPQAAPTSFVGPQASGSTHAVGTQHGGTCLSQENLHYQPPPRQANRVDQHSELPLPAGVPPLHSHGAQAADAEGDHHF